MADLDPELVRRFKDYKKFERGQIGRAALAMPAGLSAMRAGGPDAMRRAVANAYDRGQTAPTESPLDYANMKLKVLESLGDAKKRAADAAARAGKASASTKAADRLDAFKAALQEATKLADAQGDSSTQMALERMKQKTKAIETARIQMLGKDKIPGSLFEQAQKLATANQSSEDGPGGMDARSYWAGVERLIHDAPDAIAKQAVYAMLIDGSGMTTGEWHERMLRAADEGMEGASNLMSDFEVNQHLVDAQVQQQLEFAQKTEADLNAVIDSVRGGTPGSDSVVRSVKAYMDIYDGKIPEDEPPDKIADAIVAANAGLDPAKDAQQKKAFDDLLNGIDKPVEQLPTHLNEARRRLMAEPAFLQFMQKNGIPDPDQALRELRRRSNNQIAQNKLAGAESIRRQKEVERAGGTEAPQLVPPTGQPKEEAAPGDEDMAALDAAVGEVGAKPDAAPLPSGDEIKPTAKTAVIRAYDAVTRPTQSIPNAVNQIRDRFKSKRDRKGMLDENDTELSEEERKRRMLEAGVTFTPNSQGGTQLG